MDFTFRQRIVSYSKIYYITFFKHLNFPKKLIDACNINELNKQFAAAEFIIYIFVKFLFIKKTFHLGSVIFKYFSSF